MIEMVSTQIKNLIPILRDCFKQQPIEKAWLFGSCSRGEENEQSDVDILVEYDKDIKLSLLGISRIIVSIEKATGRKIDLVENGRLLPFAVNSAENDKILIYERAS